MGTGFLKGALISFVPSLFAATPNVIVFQYNPETISHDWTLPPAAKHDQKKGASGSAPPDNPLEVAGAPGETFSFTLLLDSNEYIADSTVISSTIAQVNGIYTQLAALEMLQYPTSTTNSLVGTVSAALSGSLSATVPGLTQSQVPVALFVWGPFRILPVRVKGLSITEKLYDTLLNPVQADVKLTLDVLTPQQISGIDMPLMKTLANAAYVYSQGLRQLNATANLGNAASSILGMLPIQI
jgi:hypothetical protein